MLRLQIMSLSQTLTHVFKFFHFFSYNRKTLAKIKTNNTSIFSNLYQAHARLDGGRRSEGGIGGRMYERFNCVKRIEVEKRLDSGVLFCQLRE